jgi:hypothetical protein
VKVIDAGRGVTVWGPGSRATAAVRASSKTARAIGQAPLASHIACPMCCPADATVPAGFAETF